MNTCKSRFVSLANKPRDPAESVISVDQLYNAMTVSNAISFPQNLSLQLYKSSSVVNRRSAVHWMNKVMTAYSTLERDLAIRIFDAFLIISFKESPASVSDTVTLGLAAATAMIISTKLSNTSHHLSAVSCERFHIFSQ